MATHAADTAAVDFGLRSGFGGRQYPVGHLAYLPLGLLDAYGVLPKDEPTRAADPIAASVHRVVFFHC